MALKIRTVMTYPLNGSTVDFMITFEYLARKFVTVTLVGKDRKELILNQDYRFSEKNKITTTRAWGGADGYSLIEVRRYTSATDRLVDFADGSILRAYDLNISQVQTLHVAEEARDLTADTIGVNNDGDLDARGRKIVNLADPTGDYDAVNLRTIKQWNDGAYQSYIKAQQEADRSRDEADRSKREADRSQSARVVSESAKDQSISAASRSETARDRAISAENNSSSSAAAALKSETNAKSSENNSWSSYQKSLAEANRSEKEADRAKTEADKLGNMNALGAALESVTPPSGGVNGRVVWKYDVDSQTAVRAYQGYSLGWGWEGKGQAPFFNFYRGKNNPHGSISVEDGGSIHFSGMKEVRIKAPLYTQQMETQGQSIQGNWNLQSGEFYNNSGSWLNFTARRSAGNGAGFRTNGLFMWNGTGNSNQRSEYFLEDNGARVAQTLVVTNGGNQAWYTFEEHGLVVNKNIRVSWGGRQATFHENGDVATQNGIWKGGSLSKHVNRFLVNVWIGAGRTRHVGQTSWEGWIDDGCVMRGLKQIRAGSDCFIEELFFNEMWKATDTGQWMI